MDVRALKDKATELFSKGKFAKAAETYEQYCKADPKDLQARLRMGDAWSKSGKKDRAISAYQAAAEGFARDGFLPRAIAASKLVLELDPAHKGVSQMLADLYARKSGASRPSTARTIGAKPDPVAEKPAPSPTTRADAIEITVDEEAAVPEKPAKVAAAPTLPAPGGLPAELEIEVAVPGAGAELEIEIVAPDASSAELEIELEVPLDPTAQHLPKAPVDLDPLPAREPSVAPSFELELEAGDPVLEPEPARQAQAPSAGMAIREAAPIEAIEAIEAIEPIEAESIETAKPLETAKPIEAEPIEPAEEAEDAPEAIEPVEDAEPLVLTKRRTVEPTPTPTSSPPGLKPRQPHQSSPSARIWLPPAFQAPTVPPRDAAAPTPSEPVTRVASPKTELERSLEAFSQFDVDAPVAAVPVVPKSTGPSPTLPSFTELELEGDTLLQAVEAAAAVSSGVPQSSNSISLAGEELMDAPDEPRPESGELPKIPLFSDLPEEAFIALFERCPLRRTEPGDRIIEQGSQGTSFFVICSGKVRVVRTEGEASRELATLEEGSFFGEMALLSDAPRSASVEAAAEDTQLLEIPAIVLTDLSSRHPTVASALKKFCRQRLLANLMNTAALFRPFTKSERRDLVQKFRARDAVAGEVLIREGQPSDGLYVVLTGEVSVSVGPRTVATLKEGQVFGEMSLLTRSPTSATVRTTRRTSYLRLPKEDFDHLIMSHPQILEQVAELTDERRRQNAALQARPDATTSMV